MRTAKRADADLTNRIVPDGLEFCQEKPPLDSIFVHSPDTEVLRRPSGTRCEFFAATFPALRAGLKSSASLRDFSGVNSSSATQIYAVPYGTPCEFCYTVPSTACWAKVFGVPTGLFGCQFLERNANLRRPLRDSV